MKNILRFITISFSLLILVSCNDLSKNYKVNIFVEDKLIETHKVKENTKFEESNIKDVSKLIDLNYWSTSKNGSKYDFNTLVTADLDLFAVAKTDSNLSEYYQNKNLENLRGKELQTALNSLITTNIKLASYGGNLNDPLRDIDKHPTVANSVYTIYDGEAMRNDQNGSGGPNEWNKEHVMPRSWFNKVSKYKKFEGDLHNLRISRASLNSDHGNKLFIDGNGSARSIGIGYFAGDDHLGDVARIAMYMMVIMPDQLPVNKIVLGNKPMDTLYKWHINDPVDDFEIRRNERIFSYQFNRNPFIDHPEFASQIWSDSISTLSSSDEYLLNILNTNNNFLILDQDINYIEENKFNIVQ